MRNPFAGEPFTDADASIAAALEDVNVPALLCSLVHMTGDAGWIRDARSERSRCPPTITAASRSRSGRRSAGGRCPPSPPISQLVWAHPSIRHSHYKNPAGKVYTLSPWPIDQYSQLTREIRPEDYMLT